MYSVLVNRDLEEFECIYNEDNNCSLSKTYDKIGNEVVGSLSETAENLNVYKKDIENIMENRRHWLEKCTNERNRRQQALDVLRSQCESAKSQLNQLTTACDDIKNQELILKSEQEKYCQIKKPSKRDQMLINRAIEIVKSYNRLTSVTLNLNLSTGDELYGYIHNTKLYYLKAFQLSKDPALQKLIWNKIMDGCRYIFELYVINNDDK